MSQVTKPIALDETLQDVVTAIQGITRGGMIVSTGNVGSSTQPVYINGGVPTAAWTGVTREIPDGSTAGWYKLLEFNLASSDMVLDMSTWNPTVSGDLKGRLLFGGRYGYQHITFIGGANGGNSTKFRTTGNDYSTGYLEVYYEGSGTGKRTFTITPLFGSVTIYSSPTASSETTAKASIEILPKARGITTSAQVRQPIVTGTATSINTNLTLDGSNSRIQKSGNVVCFKLQFTIANTYTPSSVTESVCTLPFKPVGWENVSRLIATAGHGSAVMGAGFLSSSGTLCIGTSPYTGLTAGNEMVFTGTYMTND